MASPDLHTIIKYASLIFDSINVAICIQNQKQEIIYKNNSYQKIQKNNRQELVEDVHKILIDDQEVAFLSVYHDISEVNRLRNELEKLNKKMKRIESRDLFTEIIGRDPYLLKIINNAKQVARTPATVMIRGESGTGKELFANAIHASSKRSNENYLKINCSSIPEDLLESELFGYKEGAFTGAQKGGKTGLFQQADKGTLFLDEIGDISQKTQVKLLRVLQEQEILPIGALHPIPIDVRILCATNRPLETMVEKGEFREDLYYRLNVFPIFIPPLRDRKDDIELLVQNFLEEMNEFYDHSIDLIEPEALEFLKSKDWKGNIRELKNILSRAFISTEIGERTLTKEILEFVSKDHVHLQQSSTKTMLEFNASTPLDLEQAVNKTEKHCILEALQLSAKDKTKAAVLLGISLRTLYNKCKKLGID